MRPLMVRPCALDEGRETKPGDFLRFKGERNGFISSAGALVSGEGDVSAPRHFIPGDKKGHYAGLIFGRQCKQLFFPHLSRCCNPRLIDFDRFFLFSLRQRREKKEKRRKLIFKVSKNFDIHLCCKF